ncbi:hypothetical protein [Klebsiella pneumoniae]|uniref:hypothetical protein n=1 Tax=Klebsiella pneumoniae TaxID=573 RepID=UPI0035CEAB7A
MENKPLDPNQKAKIVAEAMVKHMAPVAPPVAQVKEIIAGFDVAVKKACWNWM